MNILIVGNGFDLSHYLPTKYDHFMDVMKAIEEKDLGQPIANVFKHPVDDFPTLLLKILEIKNAFNERNYQMNFDELFSKCREQWFIENTQSMYYTNEVELTFEQVIKIQYQLQKNTWYRYFKNHVEDIRTWIDFEQKIESVLIAIAECISGVEKANNYSDISEYLNLDSNEPWKIKGKNFSILSFFSLWEDEEYILMAVGDNLINSKRPNLNSKFCHGNDIKNGFDQASFLMFLNEQLEEFIDIFNLYLELIISKLKPIGTFSIKSEDWNFPDKVYSFNYTNTYQIMHGSVNVDYLHGCHGEDHNIVLGVSDLHDQTLKKIKAYGFTKYQQKLFKNTDYLFLDENSELKKKIKQSRVPMDYKDTLFYIWGHSLDVSDQEYIQELFKQNDSKDLGVRVIVYYFDKNAKFALLNNLLAILGKDKIEHWMKNKWLQFKENPKITPENAITLQDLPKL